VTCRLFLGNELENTLPWRYDSWTPSLGVKQTCPWIQRMEVADFWKPEHCCESDTYFHGGGFLETNSVQRFPCKRISNKGFRGYEQATFSMDTARLYKRPCREERFICDSSFIIRKSEVSDSQIRTKLVTVEERLEEKTVVVFLGSH
jgi:hypothetical protein